jgi:uncharacterized protein with HEPN domain
VWLTLAALEADWKTHWLVEHGVAIISEASRHLPPSLKVRHPDLPWQRTAGIGNVLRHDYTNVAAPILWALVRDSLAVAGFPSKSLRFTELNSPRRRAAKCRIYL